MNFSPGETTIGNKFYETGTTNLEEIVIGVSRPVSSLNTVKTSIYLDTRRWKDLGNGIIKSLDPYNPATPVPVMLPIFAY